MKFTKLQREFVDSGCFTGSYVAFPLDILKGIAYKQWKKDRRANLLSQRGTSTNSASTKFPELDVSLSAIGIPPSSYRSMPAAYHGAKDMYEFIVRQLRAGG